MWPLRLSSDLHTCIPAHKNFYFFYLLFLFVLRQGLTTYPWLSWNSLCKLDWPQIHKDPLASTSWVWRLEAYATMLGYTEIFKRWGAQEQRLRPWVWFPEPTKKVERKRRELTPQSCLLTPTYTPWGACTSHHTHILHTRLCKSSEILWLSTS